MKRMNTIAVVAFGVLAASTLLAVAGAPPLTVTRVSIDGGGVIRSTGGAFELSGTIGQPDAGTMSGGGFQLAGGFWIPIPPGDTNDDGLVALTDFQRLLACFAGPDIGPVPTACRITDLDANDAVDLRDLAAFQQGFTGP